MNPLIEEYIGKLKSVRSPDDVRELHRWFWACRDELPALVAEMNAELRLRPPYDLKPDLPCISIGSTRGLLVLAANPGWSEQNNRLENAYCLASPEQYCGLMEGFFDLHPQVVGKRIRWWSNPMSFIQLLPDWQNRFGVELDARQKWQRAHASRIIGGWDLFPFHSQKDGITTHALRDRCAGWLRDCMAESLRAAFRIGPELILVASKAGCELTRQLLGTSEVWQSHRVGPEPGTPIYYARISATTELVAIPYQLFSARRSFKNRDVFDAVHIMRSACEKSSGVARAAV